MHLMPKVELLFCIFGTVPPKSIKNGAHDTGKLLLKTQVSEDFA